MIRVLIILIVLSDTFTWINNKICIIMTSPSAERSRVHTANCSSSHLGWRRASSPPQQKQQQQPPSIIAIKWPYGKNLRNLDAWRARFAATMMITLKINAVDLTQIRAKRKQKTAKDLWALGVSCRKTWNCRLVRDRLRRRLFSYNLRTSP